MEVWLSLIVRLLEIVPNNKMKQLVIKHKKLKKAKNKHHRNNLKLEIPIKK